MMKRSKEELCSINFIKKESNEKLKNKIINRFCFVFLIFACLFIGYLSCLMINFTDLESEYFTRDTSNNFITTCNEMYGEPTWNKPTWGVVQVSEWTTYTNEFWVENPLVYVDGRCYTCFEVD